MSLITRGILTLKQMTMLIRGRKKLKMLLRGRMKMKMIHHLMKEKSQIINKLKLPKKLTKDS
jgi:hypothetical protein